MIVKDDFLQLKEEILKSLEPLALDIEGDPETKFSLLLQVIRFNAGVMSDDAARLCRRAYESAQAIEDARDRFEALSSLLEMVDESLWSVEDVSDSNSDDAPLATNQ